MPRPTVLRRLAVIASLLTPWPLSAQETGIDFEPAEPVSTQLVKIRANYLSSCFTGVGRAEVAGAAIRLTAFEGCICPALVPGRMEVVATVGPLAAGIYRVDLFTEPDPREPECDFPPILQESVPLAVAKGGREIRLDPPVPTNADDLTLTVLTACLAAYELPSRAGSLIRLTEIPSGIAAPCTIDPTWRVDFPLGKLPAGDHTLLIFFDDGHEPPRQIHAQSFRVHPAADPELLLQDGRFRITARWEHEVAAGPARAQALTPDTGVFWFFGPDNLELLVKALDGCSVNGHYWLFVGGLTHVGVEIRVEDTFTGAVRTYSSPFGEIFAPELDTRALACP